MTDSWLVGWRPSLSAGDDAAVAGVPSTGIFISYRRQETSALAGRLYDRLVDRFGENQVFMDVDTIELGVDFAEVITQAVGTCQVLLAVIGPQWLTATDEGGRRRLDDPDDIVRLEIEAALRRSVRVIPVLAEGAVMPRRPELPESLAALARRNALTMRHESFRYDAERLIEAINRVLASTSAANPDSLAAAQVAPGTRHEPSSAPSTPSETPTTRSTIWNLELIGSEGGRKSFRLSSDKEVHEITVVRRFSKDFIAVDGRTEIEEADITGKEHILRRLSQKIGSIVTIQIKAGTLATLRIKKVTLSVGDEVFIYESGIK
jgi:hypothetical protein